MPKPNVANMSSYTLQARENMLSGAPRKSLPESVKREGETNAALDWDINPLALPKGKIVKCEVCKDRCRYHCPYCKAAFYCTKEHREKDYRTIHKDICTRLDFLNVPKNPRCNDERIRVIKQHTIIKTEIVAIAKGLADTSLFELRAEDALEQLKAAFKYLVEVDGPNSVKLVEIYALYIEAFIKAGDMPKAEEQLRKAEWILLDEGKNCPAHIMADFYKNEGQYNVATSNMPDSLISFSNEVFFATMAYHQEHSRVATGLFHLGQVFLREGEPNIALSHFIHTTDIWLRHLGAAIKQSLEETHVKHAVDLGGSVGARVADISEEEKQDAWTALQFIAQHTIYDPSVTLSTLHMTKITCGTGMTELIFGNFETAAEMAMKVKVGLHDIKNQQTLLEMTQDLYRAANKGMKKKDFKAVSTSFKNIARMQKRSITLEEIMQKHSAIAADRNIEHQKIKDMNEEADVVRRSKKETRRPTIFGEDNYTLNELKRGGSGCTTTGSRNTSTFNLKNMSSKKNLLQE